MPYNNRRIKIKKKLFKVISFVDVGAGDRVFRLITLYKTVKEVPRRVALRDRRPVSPRGTKVLNE